MSSSLITERNIVFSPSLAATIGVEEAILLHVLHDAMSFRQSQFRNGFDWFELDAKLLESLLPFWPLHDIQRIAKNLVDLGIILLDSPPLTQSLQLHYAINQSQERRRNEADTSQPPERRNPPANSAHALATPISPAPATREASSTIPGSSFRRATPSPLPGSELASSAYRKRAGDRERSNISDNDDAQFHYGANYIAPNWRPSNDVVAQIAQHNIPEDFMLAQLPEFITYWRERHQVSHAWGAKFLSHVLKQWRQQQQHQGFDSPQTKTSAMNRLWRPSEDAVEILTRVGIDRTFIDDAIPEFVLYWQERGDATSTWNSKFIKHVKIQWARYTSSLQHDTVPKRIPENWHPSQDVYDILSLANINTDFARGLVKEFVLFWRDSNQLHSSWNSKFLQHVKYHWAKQHQLATAETGIQHAGRQNPDGTRSATTGEFIRRHSDRSWADGL